jgi:hypothetical protein
MKIKFITLAAIAIMMTSVISSCYKNKADIETLPTVSFRTEVVPIVTSGACGCHNNGVSSNAVQFSHLDTIFYPAILARVGVFKDMVADASKHPGSGGVTLTNAQKTVLQTWFAQGAKVAGGGTCHGTVSPVLTYSLLLSDKDKLTAMMNSGGATGHPGPVLSLNSCTTNTILTWIAQGQPQ